MLRQFTLTLWNTYAFFVTYANLDGWTPAALAKTDPAALAPIDRWALARLNGLVCDVSQALDEYDVYAPAKAIESFVEELSNWYVRRNRRRFWKAESDADKQAAYSTLYTCLTTLSRLLAPSMPFLAEEMYRNLVADHDQSAPPSVHLAAWPEVDTALLDDQLLADTAVLLEACSLGRAARRSAGLKVRQPLGEVLVRAPRGAEGLRRFEGDLLDELNIKSVRYLDSSAGFVEYRFKPNLRLVGKKYGKRVPALTAALRELEGQQAREAAQAVESGKALRLAVDGEELELLPEELLLESSSPEGYAVAEGNGVLVALDTTLTPELEAEGLARELVRNIQDARKSAGFAISDRINVYLDGADNTLRKALSSWGEYVRGETLADELTLGPAPAGAHLETLDLETGAPLTLGVVRKL
jgi:isoleucyl-tRNA synthetase